MSREQSKLVASVIGQRNGLKLENDKLRAKLAESQSTCGELSERLAAKDQELSESNHWRERHSKDAEAYGKQSQSNWEKCKEQEQRIAQLEQRVAELEATLADALSHLDLADTRNLRAQERERKLLAVIERAQQHDHSDGDDTDCSLCAAIQSVMPTQKEGEV